jgi:EmrB/QacA subfamily drug resistance transporter
MSIDFSAHPQDQQRQRRWWALLVLCMAELMIVLDTTIVNVALPSIKADLQFSEASLVWVVNAYMLTFGGFLLLGGRLGDIYGQRKLFLAGVALFTLASLGCGLAQSQHVLIIARALQGLAGAVATAVALSLMMGLFAEPADRAKAMGIYGFVCAGGGSLGVLLGGVLTSTLSWHWVFLVNLPIGLLVLWLARGLLPPSAALQSRPALDIGGAVTITASLMLAVYAIVGSAEMGWTSPVTLGLLLMSGLLLAAFIGIESRVRSPLMPLDMFRLRNVTFANLIAVLWAAALFAWFFLSALYMQGILGLNAMQVGLAFLPSNIIMAVFSLGLSDKLVMRFGLRKPLCVGLFFATIGLLLFMQAPVDGSIAWHVMPGMVLLGLAGGIAFNPLLMAAMNDVDPKDSGLASGLVNTSFMMGGALGLAILSSAAASHTRTLLASGISPPQAVNDGYHVAFMLGAICAGIGSVLGGWGMRQKSAV